MLEQYKGFYQFYDDVLKNLWNCNFYEWIDGKATDLVQGQICQSYICYTKQKTFQLEVCDPNPMDEEETKWKLKKLNTKIPLRQERLQEFDLERNEHPLVNISKLRFVILLKKIEDNWVNPNVETVENKWLVLPLFSYKPRHQQTLILDDQMLNYDLRFYIPPSINTGFRLNKESAARYNLIQEVQENNINAITAMNNDHGMQKGFKISKLALKLIVYHYYKNLKIISDLFDEGKEIVDEYQLFKLAINELIEENIKKGTPV